MSEHIHCASCGASELGCRDGDCCDDCGHADLTDEERVVIGTKAKSVSAGALLRTLARRVTATNSVTGKVNPEAMAEYEADLKDRVSKL